MRRADDAHDAETVESTDREGRAPGPLCLVAISGRAVTTHVLPTRGRVVVGRAREVGVCIDAASVSRQHAALVVSPRGLTVTDLGSANGTSVRGARVTPGEAVALRPGDALELGDVLLVVRAVAEAALDEGTGREALAPDGSRAALVVDDARMRALHALVARVAPGMINVLLLGETGVGKEVFAERVHGLSRRARGPFVRLNCASLSETLLEAELFGHEKGAFTGADRVKRGLLESADGGTVFLDELGEMPMSVQVKLLRVIEERRVTRVGGTEPIALDVRFVSATHRDLEAEVGRGRFRQDLWFRLNGISLVIPPLRERAAELDALARLFLDEAARRSGLAATPTLAADALAALRAHPWPGNLRELRNVMERAALLCDGEVRAEHLPFAAAMRATAPPDAARPAPDDVEGTLRAQLYAIEKQRILDALTRCGGNQSRAAAMLKLPRRTLLARLDAYGVPRPRKAGAPTDEGDD